MTELRIPPDGIIARTFADLAEDFTAAQRTYLRACLLRAMREEPLPAPAGKLKLKMIDAVFVRDRAKELVPRMEKVRAGEARLPVAPVQDVLPSF